ncbi:YnbE family lipoprotein [Phenylobacterium immobile]|uniref:YnbE family lipoprotein n=1 Tax=Phenylobacterium immobile TaxID=21 RepID=UPI003CCBBBA7
MAMRIPLLAIGGFALTLAACTPTIRVAVEPITIYAKLDANVRLQLDEEVKSLIQQNPNLF